MFSWDKGLREAVDLAKAIRPVDISPFLFCTTKGTCYVMDSGRSDGWRALWDRFMKLLKKQTSVKEHFTDHDFRAKVASDESSDEAGRELLRHSNVALTRRVYRRKTAVVKPANYEVE